MNTHQLVIVFAVFVLATTAYRNTDFNFFVYAQQWPATVCTQSNITHRHACSIPKIVSTWSIHGLWPSSHNGRGPSFCNRSTPFSEEKIATIETTLLKYWPNLYTDEPMLQFWAHEWNKHGTCAAHITGLKNELAYFKQGLKLNRRFDILSILQAHDISPSDDKMYSLNSITEAFTSTIGTSVNVQCYYDHKQKRQYLLAVQVCIDKTFSPIECNARLAVEPLSMRRKHRGGSWCNPKHPVAYLKLHHAPTSACTSSED